MTNNIVDSVFKEALGETSTVSLILRNDASLILNTKVLSKLPGEQHVYYSIDRITTDDKEEGQNYQEILYSLMPSGMPEHQTRANTMLLHNWIYVKGHLRNGCA